MNIRKLVIIGIFAAIILIPFAIFAVGVLRRPPQNLPAAKLSIWTVFDEEDSFLPVINAFKNLHRNAEITVTTKRAETYEQELLEAWARGAGPDIFSVPTTALGRYEGFITPMPQTTRVPYYEDKKFLWKTDTSITYRNDPMLTARNIEERFVDVVADDVIRKGSIYGLPLAMDTMVLFYNRDLLNSAQIVSPAKTWQELVSHVPKLTLVDQTGAIIQSGVALGTAENLERPTDILALLMMQNGTLMTDATGRTVTFERQLSEDVNPGVRALSFYADFAEIGKEVYAWNAEQPNALDAFIGGSVAYFFGYGYHADAIVERAPNLNWGMSDMLHINPDGTDNFEQKQRIQINIPNYWVWSVAKQSPQKDLAWNFVQYAADANRVQAYLEATGGIAALRSVLEKQVAGEDRPVIARQALSARHWYRGENAEAMEQSLRNLITAVNNGTAPGTALGTASKQIQLTYEK